MLISELNCTTYIYDASLCCVIMGLNIEHFMLNETSINIVCECKWNLWWEINSICVRG